MWGNFKYSHALAKRFIVKIVVSLRVLDVETWDSCGHLYDIISCLNVLDRCDKPLSLLRSIYNSLSPGGYVLLAVVLPFDPFVEKGVHRHVIQGCEQ